MTPKVQLYNADCLEILAGLPTANMQAIITDPPFGTGTAEWDNDPDPQVWVEMRRICPDGPIAVIGYAKPLVRWSRFFEFELIGKIVWYKYNEPMVSPGLTRIHQDIYIWGKSQKQIHVERVREPYSKLPNLEKWHGGKPTGTSNEVHNRIRENMIKRNGGLERHLGGRRCSDLWEIPAPAAGFNAHLRQHPNQKPLDLIKRLVLLLTDEGDTVLDPFMGSGTTGQAALNLGRKFIGVELMSKYYKIAEKNINAVLAQMPLPL